MKKIAIIFLALVFAIAVDSKRSHRFINISESVESLSGLLGDAHNQSNLSAPDNGSDITDLLNQALHGNASSLQRQINDVSPFVSELLTNTYLQDIIRNYTRKARNIVELLDVSVVRASAHAVINQVFSSLSEIRGDLVSGLTEVNNSRTPISSLREFVDNAPFLLFGHIISINETINSALKNITDDFAEELSEADNETISDLQSILGSAVAQAENVTSNQINKMVVVSRVLSLKFSVLNNTARGRLERQVRQQTSRLIGELRGLNISRLHGVASHVVNYVLDQAETFQNRTIALANRALADPNPGNVLNDAFLSFKSGLGRSIVDFRRNTERAIIRFIRDTFVSVNIQNLRGSSLQNVLDSASRRVEARVNEISSLLVRVNAAQ